MTRNRTLASIATAALVLLAPAGARAGDITDALVRGAVGIAANHLGGQGLGIGARHGDRFAPRVTHGYRDGYDRERRIYDGLASRYGHRAVDACFDSRRCTALLADAWNSGSQRAIDRVFGGR